MCVKIKHYQNTYDKNYIIILSVIKYQYFTIYYNNYLKFDKL